MINLRVMSLAAAVAMAPGLADAESRFSVNRSGGVDATGANTDGSVTGYDSRSFNELATLTAPTVDLTAIEDRITNIENTVNNNVTTMSDLSDRVNQAQTTADDAYSAANNAQATADSAYARADSAYSRANSAYSRASSASSTASSAYSAAQSGLVKKSFTESIVVQDGSSKDMYCRTYPRYNSYPDHSHRTYNSYDPMGNRLYRVSNGAGQRVSQERPVTVTCYKWVAGNR